MEICRREHRCSRATVQAIVDRNNDVADASVRWSIDDSDLITLLQNDDEESGYTKKSASVQVNLNSSFITDIVRKLEKSRQTADTSMRSEATYTEQGIRMAA